MNTTDLQNTIANIQSKIENFPPLEGEKAKLTLELERIKDDMAKIEVPLRYGEVYFSLVEKGNKLLEEFSFRKDPKEVLGKIKYYISYIYAAHADFTGKSGEISSYYRLFLVTAILFVMLSPMMLTPFFTLLFIIPIFAGVKGIKRRSKQGFTLTMLVAPASLMTGILWARNAGYVFTNPSVAVEQFMATAGYSSLALGKALTFVPPILGCVLLGLGVAMSITGFRLRKFFV